jgi:gluconate 2-dehydrogenase gamma chain
MTETRPPEGAPLRLFPRRRFIRDGAMITGAAVAGVTAPLGADAASRNPFARWMDRATARFQDDLDAYEPVALTADELTTLKAAIDRIIPSDELGPGAVEAGVFVAIDRNLSGAGAATLPLYQGGLAALDAAAGTGGFAALDAAKQDDLLTQAEAGTLADLPEGFFPLLLANTKQGMFGDPIHGGNKDFAGWDLIGFPGIKLVWTEADQQIDATVKPEHKSVEAYGGEA